MSLESLWIETCPDGLFYNPTAELCDWSSKPRPTTRSNEVVKNRPVLFKTKVNDNALANEVEAQPSPASSKVVESPVASVAPAREVESRPQAEASTPSLLDELRRKLNLVDSNSAERPPRVVEESSSTRRPVKLVEISPDRISNDEETTKRPRKQNDQEVTESEFVLEKTTRRGFLKSNQ